MQFTPSHGVRPPPRAFCATSWDAASSEEPEAEILLAPGRSFRRKGGQVDGTPHAWVQKWEAPLKGLFHGCKVWVFIFFLEAGTSPAYLPHRVLELRPKLEA